MWLQAALMDPGDRIDYGLNISYVPDLEQTRSHLIHKKCKFQQAWKVGPANIPILQMRKSVSGKWWLVALSESKAFPLSVAS